MSYSIYIGEAAIDNDGEDTAAAWLSVRVGKTKHPKAPVFVGDEMTGNTNGRHPGYGQWAEFCRATGLHKLFFDREDGLMRKHPGCCALRAAHLDAVRKAIINWKMTHKKEPGWDDPPPKSATKEKWWEH